MAAPKRRNREALGHFAQRWRGNAVRSGWVASCPFPADDTAIAAKRNAADRLSQPLLCRPAYRTAVFYGSRSGDHTCAARSPRNSVRSAGAPLSCCLRRARNGAENAHIALTAGAFFPSVILAPNVGVNSRFYLGVGGIVRCPQNNIAVISATAPCDTLSRWGACVFSSRPTCCLSAGLYIK